MKSKNNHIARTALLLGLAFAFVGCNSTTQTTSGRDYISKYEAAPTGGGQSIDAEIREIASVEPILRFPAKIGLAKIHNGQIANLSEAEEIDLSTFAGHRDKIARQKNEAHIAAALNLAPETVDMFKTLQQELK